MKDETKPENEDLKNAGPESADPKAAPEGTPSAKVPEPDAVEKLKSEMEGKIRETERLAQERISAAQQKFHELTGELSELRRRQQEEREQAEETRKQESWKKYEQKIDEEMPDNPELANSLKRFRREQWEDFQREKESLKRDLDAQVARIQQEAREMVLKADPRYGKVQEFDKQYPDMAGIPSPRKIEIMEMREAQEKARRQDQEPDADMLTGSPPRSGRTVRREQNPEWTRSNEARALNRDGYFKDEKEMADWSNPQKAAQMAQDLVEKETRR